jgi:hypothetical protein
MFRLARQAAGRLCASSFRSGIPTSIFNTVPKRICLAAISPLMNHNVRTFGTQRKRGVWKTYLQPMLMLGGFVVVVSIILAIGGQVS